MQWLGITTEMGTYISVGSAYHLQWLHKFGNHQVNQNVSGVGDEKIWTNLWKLDVPAKIKIFAWRVMHGLIPCHGILANRDIGNVGSCPVCQEGCEDIKHMLFSCNRAKEIWDRLGLSNKLQVMLQADRSGSVVVAEIIKGSKPVETLNHVGLADMWWERRKMTHGETVQNSARSAVQ